MKFIPYLAHIHLLRTLSSMVSLLFFCYYLSTSCLAWALPQLLPIARLELSFNLPSQVSCEVYSLPTLAPPYKFKCLSLPQNFLIFPSYWPFLLKTVLILVCPFNQYMMPSQAFGNRVEGQSPAQASLRLKCTYQDCFRYFSSEKDMKTHKRKEPSHEYCHKCDVDCEDDSDLLIHMIESGKHSKFLTLTSSISTRLTSASCVSYVWNRVQKQRWSRISHSPGKPRFVHHCCQVGLTKCWIQTHQQSQNLKCIGCGEKFARAAGLMQHIENGECTVITQEIFQRRRAEKAITKDAWAAQLQPDLAQNIPRGNISTFSDATSTEHGGVSLLDDDSLFDSNMQSNAHQEFLTPSLHMLSLRDQYPTLGHLNPPQQKKAVDEDGNDLTSSDGAQLQNVKVHSKAAWSASSPAASTLFQSSKSAPPPTQHAGDIVVGPSASSSAVSTNSNAHLTTQPAPLMPASLLDPMNHFNDITNKFECPGRQCGGLFNTIESFNAHLTSSAHVGGRTVCPSCLSKFASTMALVAHCESPSKRCNIRNTANYNQVLREITGGLIGTEGHHIDGSVKYVANDITKPGYW